MSAGDFSLILCTSFDRVMERRGRKKMEIVWVDFLLGHTPGTLIQARKARDPFYS
jgi:hypothetical protein